ncbi:GntR family transcriptional regulator [Streptomyces sp. NBC_01381]|uniref:GntR family transcriptional regulator n=1 Tax=Streptomyces sp. NBC_01381 TaxID=2903845 RepID=UPI0022585DD1|nr:GntR family transcriptional regulator [Streptomyces sp. NBC_01381]MCX4673624.1 GntR family transcriptional regulator [Streptomyces sp. NBC_01381]
MPPKPKEAPRVREIAADLLAQITSGELSPGEKLPSTAELAAQHEVSDKTIFRVIALLKATGHVNSRQGKGTFVRKVQPLEWHLHTFESGQRRDDPALGRDDWKAAVAEQGRVATQDTPRVSVVPAPADVAQWLRVKPGTHVVVRRRVRRVDGEAYQLADSWFPAKIALDTPLMFEEDVTMPGGILASTGNPQKSWRDEFMAWPPITAEEAERLELPPDIGTPIVRHARIGFGADGEPVRVMVTVAPGHLNKFVYEGEA